LDFALAGEILDGRLPQQIVNANRRKEMRALPFAEKLIFERRSTFSALR
jgi:hypothetical protein